MLSFKVGSIGLIAVLAACFVGCGDDGDGGGSGGSGAGGSGATGATGGSGASGGSGATGGTGATGGSGATGGTGGAATVMCGSNTCEKGDVLLNGTPTLAFPACCVADACGLNVDSAADILPVSGCIQTDTPGEPDSACPGIDVEVLTETVTLPGCCQANGMCGVTVDVTELGGSLGATGPNFGCQDPAPFSDAGTPTPCGT